MIQGRNSLKTPANWIRPVPEGSGLAYERAIQQQIDKAMQVKSDYPLPQLLGVRIGDGFIPIL